MPALSAARLLSEGNIAATNAEWHGGESIPTALPEWLNAGVKSVKKLFLPIQARHENTVPKPVMANPAERRTAMTNEKLQHIAAYKVTIIIFRKLLSNGTITEAEFRKCESNIAEKCGLSLCSIYRKIPWLYPASDLICNTDRRRFYGENRGESKF